LFWFIANHHHISMAHMCRWNYAEPKIKQLFNCHCYSKLELVASIQGKHGLAFLENYSKYIHARLAYYLFYRYKYTLECFTLIYSTYNFTRFILIGEGLFFCVCKICLVFYNMYTYMAYANWMRDWFLI
jgi:hypothetical protein